MSNCRPIIVIMLIICLVPMFVLLGCSKINQENYDRLKVGLEYDEVLKILGKPEYCESVLKIKNCTWEKSSKIINIVIIADKVVLISNRGFKNMFGTVES